MPNQIKAANRVAQPFIENLPQAIADKLDDYSGVECFGWHWQSVDACDDHFVYAFTDDKPPQQGEIVLVPPLEAHYNGQENARRIVAHYFEEGSDD